MAEIKDISNRRFRNLLAIKYIGRNKLGHAKWLCRCDCGKDVVNLSNKLLTGNSGTCGCRNGHGMRHNRIYRTWINMKQRCYNPNQEGYRFYGARGIEICDAWRTDFKSFHSWAMENGYKENLTIDRINPKGNYCPENCQWLTMSENVKRRIKVVVIK